MKLLKEQKYPLKDEHSELVKEFKIIWIGNDINKECKRIFNIDKELIAIV